MFSVDANVVYSHILRYLDLTPVDSSTAKVYEDQYHWLTRLEYNGFAASSNLDTNYKSIYMMLALHFFNAEETFLKACKEGLQDVVTYLLDYVEVDNVPSCANVTADINVVRTLIVRGNMIELLLSVRNNRNKVSSLLESVDELGVTQDNLDTFNILLQSNSSDLIASKVDIVNVVAHFANAAAARVFDLKGYNYPIDKAVEYDLANSVDTWLHQPQSQQSIKHSLLMSLRFNTKVGIYILAYVQGGYNTFIDSAVRYDNYHVLSLLPYTTRDLSLAISLGKVNAVKAMVSVSTSQHLAQCIKQRRLAERDVIQQYLLTM